MSSGQTFEINHKENVLKQLLQSIMLATFLLFPRDTPAFQQFDECNTSCASKELHISLSKGHVDLKRSYKFNNKRDKIIEKTNRCGRARCVHGTQFQHGLMHTRMGLLGHVCCCMCREQRTCKDSSYIEVISC